MSHWSQHFPWRQIQTNLPEIDMEDIDAEVYVESLKKMHASVAMINTSGIIASYKTDLPFHFQSPHLNGDSLETIIAACHREGVKVIARTDFSKVRRPIYEEHPDWACIFPGGVIEDFAGNVHCCVNSDYQRIYAPQIIEETLTKLDIDGIFFNMGGYNTENYEHRYLGICQCEKCKTMFYDRFQLILPVQEDMNDPAFRKYLVFKRETISSHRSRIVKFIKKIRPDIMIDKVTEGDFGFERVESNTEFKRPLPHWQYSGSDNSKCVVASHPEFKSSNTSVDFIGFFYRHVAVAPALQELRLWQGLLACGGLDYYLIGRLDNHRDRSGYEGVKRVFSFHEKHFKDTYDGLTPDSKTLLISLGGFESTDDYRGMYRLLSENHILFDVISIGRITKTDLSEYDALVLPNCKYFSDEAASCVDKFVEQGGTLVATGETAFYDDEYERRESCALESTGILHVKHVRHDMRSAMLELDSKEGYPSMEDRDLIYFGDTFIFAEYSDSAKGSLRLIPPHWVGPPERCYWKQVSDIPGVVVNSYGKGKCVFLPWLPGRLFLQEGHDNTVVFMGDLLKETAALKSVGGNLSPMVEVSMARGANDFFSLIQLVNTSGHYGTTFYDPIPMADLKINVPFNVDPVRVIKLSDGSEVPFSYNKGHLSITLDRLGFHEGLKILLV
ncbi:hypothetical protein EXM22_16165 [Oceanispirochaeta crateris]|uniref:Beta-galactosidase trimerisation domain-containing protein n=1 Tax=Oceanispirochaeta crateris TaxID=2518645 RepID=A0A5C1QQF9_9SPIO|nr:alpha-amylase family protein [Oceanispirochaeta crateris]QEN09439.1 hypothetical protein EXM22_16165 [Oceanispirochaeta crateris]